MGFFKDIADLMIKDDSLRDLDQTQCEAIIDAMTFLALADGEETVLERSELDHLLHDLPWALREGDAAQEYKKKSAERMKVAADAGEDAMQKVAAEIAARIEGHELRKKTLKMAAAVAYANWDAGEHEHDALVLLSEALEIPAPFAKAIIHDIGEAATETGDLEEDTDPEHLPAPAGNTIREVLSSNFLEGFFNDLFNDDDLRHLDEAASYAFVDALTLALVSDGYPEQEELQEFKTQIENLPFALEDADHVKARVEIVIETLRQADDAGRHDYMSEVAAKIPTNSLREHALRMAIAITHADFEITSEENSVLMKMANAFEVSSTRMEELIGAIEAEREDDFL